MDYLDFNMRFFEGNIFYARHAVSAMKDGYMD
jgi:hypothetical protein